jgi:transformation/transcription domain-associated protein
MPQFTLQLSLACFAEYVLHLTRLNPDMMYIHQDSGLVNVSYFKFDVDDTIGKCFSYLSRLYQSGMFLP